MEANKNADGKPLVYLVIGVCLAGGVVAWFFGALAAFAYDLPYVLGRAQPGMIMAPIGRWWGAFTGLLAGAIWCRWMIPLSIQSPEENMAKKGAVAGIVVGVVSTILLHAGLMFVSDRAEPFSLAIGLLCGVVAGWIVGRICGMLCRRAVNRAYPVDARIDDQKAAE
jgi:hypothetical protein